MLPVTELQAARLTPWDPWYWRRLEQRELRGELPPGLPLSARPFDSSVLGETEILGWQGPRLDLEASGVTGFPVVRERRGAWMTRGFNSVARIESGWTSDLSLIHI